jgi:hypothetical protein
LVFNGSHRLSLVLLWLVFNGFHLIVSTYRLGIPDLLLLARANFKPKLLCANYARTMRGSPDSGTRPGRRWAGATEGSEAKCSFNEFAKDMSMIC